MIDMKIRDEELVSYATQVKEIGQCIDARIAGLKAQLETVCQNGVISGDFHDNLELFITLLGSLEEKLTTETSVIASEVEYYLERIDVLDGLTY